jgi:transcriptional regulator with XRE-family HTH domain
VRSLPDLLRAHLKRRNLSQVAFAKLVGMKHSSISHIARGKRYPRPNRSDTWCRALNLSSAEAEELTDAIHLAAATPRVRAIVARLERQAVRRTTSVTLKRK